MGHLDDDVAAYVDGQLPESAALAARRHLEGCEPCRWAVAQQEAMKARMRQAGGPIVPHSLMASLAQLPDARIEHEPWSARLRRSRTMRVSTGVLGSCVALLAVAFALGAPDDGPDAVTPPFAAYVAAFAGPGASPVLAAGSPIDDVQAERLTAEGWPCHHTLAGDLRREHGSQDASTVALSYGNGTHRLDLYEQQGALSEAAVRGFSRTTVAGSPVWMSAGSPTILTWDADGLVYTVVTDAGTERIGRTLAELPTPASPDDPSLPERVGDGFARMAGWVADAA
ncbi:zf-HC2 domain-containing protein [Aeromicrobium massiliense]|uniref:zf-HC2 domain-containing protein n=1 Tax=Aeromicrobium massiliense TaxID=1464554 RepID=UPI0002FE8320|nr:zf-HC2 domain-containing protein [Aeromicrobium massiliense]